MRNPDQLLNHDLRVFPGDTARDAYQTNAFVDPNNGRIVIGTNSGNPGTATHELIHKAANPDFSNHVPFQLNEGMNEYFTRQITDPRNINRGNVEYNAIGSTNVASTLARIAGEDVARRAYFGTGVGDAQALSTAIDARGGAGTWAEVQRLMGPHPNPADPANPLPPDPDAALALLRARVPGT
jgi:hypothetical protein